MFLREFLASHPLWLPDRGKARQAVVDSPLVLKIATGFTRQYCHQIWRGEVPMTRRIVEKLVVLSRGSLSRDVLYALEPKGWPVWKKQMNARYRVRLRQQLGQRRPQRPKKTRPPPADSRAP